MSQMQQYTASHGTLIRMIYRTRVFHSPFRRRFERDFVIRHSELELGGTLVHSLQTFPNGTHVCAFLNRCNPLSWRIIAARLRDRCPRGGFTDARRTGRASSSPRTLALRLRAIRTRRKWQEWRKIRLFNIPTRLTFDSARSYVRRDDGTYYRAYGRTGSRAPCYE